MKYLPSVIYAAVHSQHSSQHFAVLKRYIVTLCLMIAIFSTLFHFLMLYEGQQHSWLTGIYWTLTVMSTLGFGDITFTSDLGRTFSILVLLTGVIFFLILLPFAFIQHFYLPWVEQQKMNMVPRRLPPDTTGHVLIAGTDPISLNLSKDLSRYGVKSFLVCNDTQTALQLLAQGYPVAVGEHDDMLTYRYMRAECAALLVVLDSDVRSTNIVFSAREAAPELTIVAGVEKLEARDILRMAGCSRCFHFYSLLGEALGRRVIKPSNRVSVLGCFGHIIVAEAPVMRTPLAGKTLLQSALRHETGVNVVGVWERGVFTLPRLETTFSHSTVLVVAGTEPQIQSFNRLLSSTDQTSTTPQPPVIILGGGRVGFAVARSLKRRNMPAVIVDKNEQITFGPIPVVHGDASDLSVLEKAGIRTTSTVIVTTHNDDANIYLTIYCRRLRPDVQLISRASLERNINGLHMAGADLVLSLSSLVSNTIINLLSPNRVLMLSERLSVFRYTVHGNLAGTTLRESEIRSKTRCSVLAVHSLNGSIHVNPEASYTFSSGDKIYLIGDSTAQDAFSKHYGIDTDFNRTEGHWASAADESSQT